MHVASCARYVSLCASHVSLCASHVPFVSRQVPLSSQPPSLQTPPRRHGSCPLSTNHRSATVCCSSLKNLVEAEVGVGVGAEVGAETWAGARGGTMVGTWAQFAAATDGGSLRTAWYRYRWWKP